MKKTVLIFTLMLLLCCLLAVSVSAKSEEESNNSPTTATEILVEEAVTGNLSSREDEDWYQFTLPADGYFQVEIAHELWDSSSTYWCIYLYDATGTAYIDGQKAYYSVQGKASLTTAAYGVTAGTYYIRVDASSYSDKAYELCVRFTADDHWESENNNSKEKADEIQVNQTYYGALTREEPQDWYKITVTERGCLRVKFEHELFDKSAYYWKLYLYDATGVDYIDGSDSCYYVRGDSNCTTSTFGVEAGTYYLKLTPSSRTDDTYRILVEFTPTDDWETENNGSKANADELPFGQSVHASLSSAGDEDWFRITVTEPGYFFVTHTHELWDSSSTYWQLRLFNDTGVAYIEGEGSYYNATGKENVTSACYGVAPGTYYLKVTDSSYSEKEYQLKAEFVPASDWETENNGSKNDADPMPTGNTVHAALSSGGDTDWFSFYVSAPCELAVTVTHETLETSGVCWKVQLYGSDGVTRLGELLSRGKDGVQTSDYVSVSAGTYYLKVTSVTLSRADYTLNVAQKHDCAGSFVTTAYPTCTAGGMQEKRCSVCNKLLETKPLEPAGHESDLWTVDREASCTREGQRHGECRICHENVTETIPMLPHSYGEAVQVSGSKLIPPIVTEKTCAVCGEAVQEKSWSYVWLPIVAVIGLIAVVIGIVNYAKAFKKRV